MAKDVIVIDTEENDDWMKSLPGYQDEVKIHEDLAKKHGKGLTIPVKIDGEKIRIR